MHLYILLFYCTSRLIRVVHNVKTRVKFTLPPVIPRYFHFLSLPSSGCRCTANIANELLHAVPFLSARTPLQITNQISLPPLYYSRTYNLPCVKRHDLPSFYLRAFSHFFRKVASRSVGHVIKIRKKKGESTCKGELNIL